MNLRRLVVALVLAVGLVLAPYTVVVQQAPATEVPPFPYQRYDQIQADLMGPACEGIAEDVRTRDGAYRILSSKTRDIFMHIVNGEVDYVYFFEGTSAEGVLHLKRALTLEQAKAMYPAGPCSYFTEREA